MTRLDSARDTAGRTKETLTPYAVTAKETALYYADGAKQLLAPRIEALGPMAAAAGAQARTGAADAAHAARTQYTKHLAPQLEHAFAGLPPGAQQTTLKAVHRAQEAALAAKLAAARTGQQARTTLVPKVTEAVGTAKATVTPLAQEAHTRGTAALTALQGHVTASEISDLAAKNIKKENRHGWATGLAVAGTVAIGSGVLIWQWYRKQSNPEWLVEPPAPQSGGAATGAAGSAPAPADGDATLVNGSTPTGSSAGASGGPHHRPADPSAADGAPHPGPAEPKPGDERPKPHDPRKPH
ncbi:DUF5324 family protein [Kitasatospora sp. NPDC048540]|uniref:DUF5324 family protein n=1 Tax=unclassified Kitasatospora TaxID=2633591 RepID=UPI00068C1200|nr:DUF5324 family protein [Kitasatospora sp. MBT63]